MSDAVAGDKHDCQHLNLPSDLSMRAAAGLKDVLGRTLARSSEVVMDAASVERMSTASVQILLAYFEAAQQLSMSVSVQSPSVAFVDAFSDLGLAASISNRQIEA